MNVILFQHSFELTDSFADWITDSFIECYINSPIY